MVDNNQYMLYIDNRPVDYGLWFLTLTSDRDIGNIYKIPCDG